MGGAPSVQRSAVNMSGDAANVVKGKINDHCVMIFSKSYCPYCKIAKKAFEDIKVTYEVMELDKHPKGDEIQDVLDQMTGARSVPRVFVGGKCIGGGTETKDLMQSGKLKEMVEQCA